MVLFSYSIYIMNKYIAECFGTMVLVLVGCGSAVIAGEQIGFLGISFAFGLAVMGMVYTIWNISGCHINPAITLGMWMRGKISTSDGISYVIAQGVWALVWAALLALIMWSTLVLGANGFAAASPWGFSLGSAFITEIIFTAIFLLVIFGVTAKASNAGHVSGLIIGLTLAVVHMVTIPVTGTSVNPARSFGPAMLQGGEAISQLWLFIIAPLLWAALAVGIWKYVLSAEDVK